MIHDTLMPTYSPPDILFEKGEGAYLITETGDKYLDFICGIAVTSFGHNHPHLVNALKSQADKYWHTSNMFRVKAGEILADRLTANSFADQVFFGNSGAEAVEAGLKMMRRYHFDKGDTNRNRIIGMTGSFHGRTIATIAAAGNPSYVKGFIEGDLGFDHVPFGDVAALEDMISDKTAGIILEPVQGEGGVMPAPDGYLEAVRALCDKHGILLMADEIQCGMGRTGKLFAYQWSSIEPDILASAKALGGGFPIGACLATKEVASCMVVGTHGSTFGGNPLATTVGNAVMDLMLEEGFMEGVQETSQKLFNELVSIQKDHSDKILDVRGKGLMLGMKCAVSNVELLGKVRENKMLAGRAGADVLRLLPPLNIADAHIDEAVSILRKSIKDV